MAYKTVNIPLANDPIGTEYQIRIRSMMNGNFLTAEKSGVLSLNRPEAKTWETWTATKLDKRTISLRSFHGKYLCAGLAGSAVANRSERKEWEVWTVENHKDAFAFRSYKNTYLTAVSSLLVAANAKEVKTNEQFEIFTVWDDERPAKLPYPNILKAYDMDSEYVLLLTQNNLTIQSISATSPKNSIVIDFDDVKEFEKGYHFLFKELHIYTQKGVLYRIRKVYDFNDAFWRIWKTWKNYQFDHERSNESPPVKDTSSDSPLNDSAESAENTNPPKSNEMIPAEVSSHVSRWQQPLIPRTNTNVNNFTTEIEKTSQQPLQQEPLHDKNELQAPQPSTPQQSGIVNVVSEEQEKIAVSESNRTNEFDLPQQWVSQRRFALADPNDKISDDILEINETLEESLIQQYKITQRAVEDGVEQNEKSASNVTEKNGNMSQRTTLLLKVPKRNGGPKRRPPRQKSLQTE
jgi:hypothetical protein